MIYNRIVRNLSKKTKYLSLFCIVVIVLLGTAGLIYSISSKINDSSEVNIDDNSKIDESRDPKGSANDIQTGSGHINTSNESGSASAFPTTKPNLTAQIENVRQSRGFLEFDTKIQPSASGECIIELSRNGVKAISTRSIINGDSCDASSINIGGLEKGVWDLTLKAQVNSNVSTYTQTVTIR